MNVYSLLENRIEDIEKIKKCILKNEYVKLYDQYSYLINYMLFISSKDEFIDFIEEHKEIKEESFLLALACNEGICCGFGLYEENMGRIVQQYMQEKSQIYIEFDGLSDNVDLLLEKINTANSIIEGASKKYIMLLDDTYSEGIFYVFLVSADESMEEWESKQIERML